MSLPEQMTIKKNFIRRKIHEHSEYKKSKKIGEYLIKDLWKSKKFK